MRSSSWIPAAVALATVACSDASIYVVYPDLSVVVTSPAPGAVYWLSETVPLAGTVTLGSGIEEGTKATWSVDGTPWSVDAELDADLDIVGEYTPDRTGPLVIRLCVVHQRSPDQACAAQPIMVTENTPPSVEIVLPQDGQSVDSETAVQFYWDVTDAEDAAQMTLLGCSWSSSIDGVLFDEIQCPIDPLGRIQPGIGKLLSPGHHVIALEVVDTRGATDADSVEIDVEGCVDADGDGLSTCGGDCDDSDATITDPRIWYADHDLDAHGRALEWVVQCDQPPGHVADGDDCDDDDPDNYPGNPEACDGADNDCSGLPDADVQLESDLDADGWRSCEECDDGEPAAFPGNPEVCDGIDNDCDLLVPADEIDADGDGFLACEDCDDGDGSTFPGAPEVCDGAVQDCDGTLPPGETDGDGDLQAPCAGDCDDADDGG